VPLSTICSVPIPGVAVPLLSNFTSARSIVSPSAKPEIVLAGIEVPSIVNVPPAAAKTIAPLTTAPACSSTAPPLMTGSLAVPPAETSSKPLPPMKDALVAPPDST
jgi:hypothetical protein